MASACLFVKKYYRISRDGKNDDDPILLNKLIENIFSNFVVCCCLHTQNTGYAHSRSTPIKKKVSAAEGE